MLFLLGICSRTILTKLHDFKLWMIVNSERLILNDISQLNLIDSIMNNFKEEYQRTLSRLVVEDDVDQLLNRLQMDQLPNMSDISYFFFEC